MDDYLKSLKLKEESADPEPSVTDVVDSVEDNEPVVEEKEKLPEDVNDTAEEAPAEEVPEPSEPAEEQTEEVSEPAEEKADEDVSKPVPAEEQQADNKAEIGKTVYVKNIRVTRTPDPKQPSWTVTGNVEILGKIEDMTIINFMKYGLGLVKGYTRDIL